MQRAILLIGHGSRRDEANADLNHVVAELRGRGEYPIVEASFLEFAEPGIDEGAAHCVRQGASHVVMLPYFLSAGVHVRRDLAAAHERLAERFPAVAFHLAEPFGRHSLLIEVVADRLYEAEKCPASNPRSVRKDIVLHLVGHRSASAAPKEVHCRVCRTADGSIEPKPVVDLHQLAS